MKIKAVNVRKENLKLSKPYTIAFKTIDVVENGIIELVTDDGIIGYGAFNPSEDVMGETLEHAMETLTQESVEWLTGNRLTIENFNTILQNVALQFPNSPSARIGLEIALHDAFTQALNVPLVNFWGRAISSMPTSITIGIKNVADTLAEAKEYIDRRFKILKVKLGASVEEDIERLVKLREAYGNSIRIIIDVNQGYSFEELITFYDKTKHLGIELIEQPLMKGEEDAMRRLPAEIKQLVAADESLINATDATNLLTPTAACGFFNIKLMKCGGLKEASDIAKIAENNNIGLMWGCNDESIISITAALHMAFAHPNTKFIDLDGSLDLAVDVVKGGFILKDGIMSISDKPGLGLERL